ncbi:MAG TPA: Rieske 2Fe-2S domain-containing protein [Chitinophagaceae bacterium]|nr:Rieske 2Fe-2S domain-containing protein [Chitinophagaceae bacterium]
MSEKKYSWYKVSDSVSEILWGENNLAEIEIKGKKICIGKMNDKLFACTNKCPHAGGRLVNGYVDAQGNIVCPVHRYRFNTTTGRNTSGEGYYLKTYVVQEREDGVYIGIEEGKSFFEWLG